jgi:hypothetical protein
MGYKIIKLQNASDYPGNPTPTVEISILDDGWDVAYSNWLSGKNPTESKEWKKGVFALTELIQKE